VTDPLAVLWTAVGFSPAAVSWRRFEPNRGMIAEAAAILSRVHSSTAACRPRRDGAAFRANEGKMVGKQLPPRGRQSHKSESERILNSNQRSRRRDSNPRPMLYEKPRGPSSTVSPRLFRVPDRAHYPPETAKIQVGPSAQVYEKVYRYIARLVSRSEGAPRGIRPAHRNSARSVTDAPGG
jgi:hypothetical protein